MNVRVRRAGEGDEAAIARLIGQLAAAEGETSPVTAAFVRDYCCHPACNLLVAEVEGEIAGVLSYIVRPSLFHAAPAVLIDDLVVDDQRRDQGIGSALLSEVLTCLGAMGFAEVSVAVMGDNEGALRFYRAHGLTEECVFLEKHF